MRSGAGFVASSPTLVTALRQALLRPRDQPAVGPVTIPQHPAGAGAALDYEMPGGGEAPFRGPIRGDPLSGPNGPRALESQDFSDEVREARTREGIALREPPSRIDRMLNAIKIYRGFGRSPFGRPGQASRGARGRLVRQAGFPAARTRLALRRRHRNPHRGLLSAANSTKGPTTAGVYVVIGTEPDIAAIRQRSLGQLSNARDGSRRSSRGGCRGT